MALWRRLVILCVWVVAGMALSSELGQAQGVGVIQSEILIVDPERLFDETLLGRQMSSDYLAKREELAALNRTLEAELEAEEKMLTDLRAELSPDEFRQMADAFDEKVQDIRKDSERRVRDLERSREGAPLFFIRKVEPILIEIMREAGGVVVIDARTVLLRADVIDITDVAIGRIDTQIGKGTPETPTDSAAQENEQPEAQTAD